MPSTFRVECDTCGDCFVAVSGYGTDTICPECFEAERTRLAGLYWDEQYTKYIYNSKSAPRRKTPGNLRDDEIFVFKGGGTLPPGKG